MFSTCFFFIRFNGLFFLVQVYGLSESAFPVPFLPLTAKHDSSLLSESEERLERGTTLRRVCNLKVWVE
jgi:hypothetical protein